MFMRYIDSQNSSPRALISIKTIKHIIMIISYAGQAT